jgi:hypothetical protein
MTRDAQKHLAKAKDYIAKGDQFYRKAKPEIEAAYQVPGTRQEDIANYLGKSITWVQDVLRWDGTGTLYGDATPARQVRQAKQTVRVSEGGEAEDIAAALIENPAMVKSVVKQISEDPKARAEATKAMEAHYEKQAKESAKRKREAEVDRAGGEEELSHKELKLRAAEVVNVARGAASSLRYVASMSDEFSSHLDVVEALEPPLEEAISYAEGALRILGGEAISDEDLRELTGGLR